MTRQLSRWKIKQLALVGVVCAISLIAGGGVPASADNGPHTAGAGPLTDSCAGCHRVHTAQAPSLLKVAQPGLCFTCHGAGDGGASTDVVNGVGYLAFSRNPANAVSGLRGGGFENALIESNNPTYNDPGPTGRGIAIPVRGTGATVTSKHSIDSSDQVAWGNGATSATTRYGGSSAVQLRCGSCHDPHGNGNYRILKPIPAQSGATPGTAMVEPLATPKTYTTTNYWSVQDANDTTDITITRTGYPNTTEKTGAFIGNVSAWCSSCHTRYLSSSAKTPSGDAVFAYRHTSNKISAKIDGTGQRTCIQCHVAHGSNASMSGTRSSSVTAPDGTGAGSSKLLRVDNRGTCQMCHNK